MTDSKPSPANAELTVPTVIGCDVLLERRDSKPPSRINGKANPEYNRWWHRQNNARVKAYRANRRDIEREYMKDWREKNKAHAQAVAKVWWAKHRSIAIKKNSEWRKKNPEKNKQIAKRAKLNMLQNLPDWYICQCLELPKECVPPQLIEAVRINIKLKRLCQSQKILENSATNCSTPSNG